MTLDKLFDLLDDWRNLPAYQLERRADIFFAIHLEEILKRINGSKIDMIIPEFPVRIGEISDNHTELNKSYKIDYLAYSKDDKKVFLVELKTDLASRRDNQDWYLKRASEIKVNGLMQGLKKIFKATDQKVKYNNLIDKVESIGWVKRDGDEINIINTDIKPEIIYIQPLNNENQDNIISFDDIISVLSDIESPLTKRFLISLERWKSNTNKVSD